MAYPSANDVPVREDVNSEPNAGRMSLLDLGLADAPDPEAEVSGLSEDSRSIYPGCLFAALPGTRTHGAHYADSAIERGAAALLTDPEGARVASVNNDVGGLQIIVRNRPRSAFAIAASSWFGCAPETVVAVTGTNGKTSVATMCRQLWEALGYPAANCGTTGIEGAYAAQLHHTTPDPVTLHRHLGAMRRLGIERVALEASSHGLSQSRLDGLKFKAAAFTNLSHEHQDYHPDLNSYFDAKATMFERNMVDDGIAVVCIDSPFGKDMSGVAAASGLELITVGRENADLQLVAQRFRSSGQTINFSWKGRFFAAELNLAGGFQGMNALTAAALLIGSGEDADAVFGKLSRIVAVRGRMELAVRRMDGSPVFVDYAHTPDALETTLKAVRPHVLGRLIVVFGAGGDRDRSKRPLMGRVAKLHSDVQFVTDDNPRFEDPASIRSEILASCPGAAEIADRAEAILIAASAMRPGDALVIAGKGHETSQTIGESVLPFDDAEQASIAVKALEGSEH